MPNLSNFMRIAGRSVVSFGRDNCSHLAAGISYYVLLSIFPLVIFLVVFAGFFVETRGARDEVINLVLANIPLTRGEGERGLEALLRGVVSGRGEAGIIGLAILVWSASAMMAAIRNSLNVVWGISERRPFWKARLLDLSLVILAGLLVTVSLVLTIYTRFAEDLVRAGFELLGTTGQAASTAVFWGLGVLAPFVLSFGVFLFAYRVLPALRVRVAKLWPGAIVAALIFEGAKHGFAFYLDNLANYNAVYGSLGAIIAFLFFVFIAASALLFGAEFARQWALGSMTDIDELEERRAAKGGKVKELKGRKPRKSGAHHPVFPHRH